MNIKVIVKRALDKMWLRKPRTQKEMVDAWEAHTHTAPILTGTITAPIPVVKPQSSMSITGNFSAGVHPPSTSQITATQMAALSTSRYNWNVASNQSQGVVAQPIGQINPYAITGSTYSTSYGNISFTPPTHCVVLNNNQNKEIVRLNTDGTVTWASDINIDEAATAFAQAMQLGVEMNAGITYGVKQRIRDAAFEELIDMAKSKGSSQPTT